MDLGGENLHFWTAIMLDWLCFRPIMERFSLPQNSVNGPVSYQQSMPLSQRIDCVQQLFKLTPRRTVSEDRQNHGRESLYLIPPWDDSSMDRSTLECFSRAKKLTRLNKKWKTTCWSLCGLERQSGYMGYVKDVKGGVVKRSVFAHLTYATCLLRDNTM